MSTAAERQAMPLLPLVANPYKRQVIAAVRRWIRASGFSWAADRCKAIVQYLLKLRAGEAVTRPPWVSSKYLTYPERVTEGGSFSHFAQIIQLWRVFTGMYNEGEDPTEEDVRKFEKAVTAPFMSQVIPDVPTAHPYATIPWGFVASRSVKEALPEVRLPRFIPIPDPLILRSRDDHGRLSEEWIDLIHGSHSLTLWANRWDMWDKWPFALRQIPWIPVRIPKGRQRPQGTIGIIRCRKQKDGKARFYLHPPAWVQYLLGPWAKSLYRALRHIPQDCTFDQEKGANQVIQWLREGRTVYSFDLSSATDRFPLALTRTVLLALSESPNMKGWVNTFSILARIPAMVGYKGSAKAHIAWKVGQPLGVVASFAAFALTHHALVRSLWRGNPSEAPYVILGDDLVIADDELATSYRRVVTEVLGVEISEAKSLHGRLGEFAGRIIDPAGWEFKLKYFNLNLRTLRNGIEVIGSRALKAVRATPLRNVIALIPTKRYPSGLNPGGFPREKVHAFQVEYIAHQLDEVDYPLRLLTDEEKYVRSRRSALVTYNHFFHPEEVEAPGRGPQGPSSGGQSGTSHSIAFAGRSEWRWTPYNSRSWLRKVSEIAWKLGLIPEPLRPKRRKRRKRGAAARAA